MNGKLHTENNLTPQVLTERYDVLLDLYPVPLYSVAGYFRSH